MYVSLYPPCHSYHGYNQTIFAANTICNYTFSAYPTALSMPINGLVSAHAVERICTAYTIQFNILRQQHQNRPYISPPALFTPAKKPDCLDFNLLHCRYACCLRPSHHFYQPGPTHARTHARKQAISFNFQPPDLAFRLPADRLQNQTEGNSTQLN